MESAVRAGATTQDLYSQYGRQIYSFCLHKLRSREEAEDAVQTTFMNAFRSLQRGATTQFEQAWLFKIAQNVCFARQSSASRRLRLEAPNDFEVLQEIVPAPDGEQPLELFGLEEALEQMPENQRRAILLREWQGLSYREIGEELELSQAAVEMLIFRARRALAGALEEPEEARGKKARATRRVGALASLVGGALKTLFGGGAAIKAVSIAAAAIAVVGESANHTIVQHSAAAKAVPVAAQASASLTSPAQVIARKTPSAAAPKAYARTTGQRTAPVRRHRTTTAPAQAVAVRHAHSTTRVPTDDSPAATAAAPPSIAPPASTPAPAPAPAPAAPPATPRAPAAEDHGSTKQPPAPVVPAAETLPVEPTPAPAAPQADPGNGHGNAYGHDKQADAPASPVAEVSPPSPAPLVSDDQGNGPGNGNGNGNPRGHSK